MLNERRNAFWWVLLIWWLSLCLGCDPLVDEDYMGEVLYELEGNVILGSGDETFQDADLRVGVVWMGDVDWRTPERHLISSGGFPARYQIELFAPPPAQTIQPFFGNNTRLAIGRVVLFVDESGDGIFNPISDPVVGGDPSGVVLYVETIDELDEVWLGTTAGFQIARWRECDAVLGEAFTGDTTEKVGVPHRLAIDEAVTEMDVSIHSASEALDANLFCSSRSEAPCATLLGLAQAGDVNLADDDGTPTSSTVLWEIYAARCPVDGDTRTREAAATCLAWVEEFEVDPDALADDLDADKLDTYEWCTTSSEDNRDPEEPENSDSESCIQITDEYCFTEAQIEYLCENEGAWSSEPEYEEHYDEYCTDG